MDRKKMAEKKKKKESWKKTAYGNDYRVTINTVKAHDHTWSIFFLFFFSSFPFFPFLLFFSFLLSPSSLD